MRQQEERTDRERESEVRRGRKSHQEGGKSVEALSKPNDGVASPGPP